MWVDGSGFGRIWQKILKITLTKAVLCIHVVNSSQKKKEKKKCCGRQACCMHVKWAVTNAVRSSAEEHRGLKCSPQVFFFFKIWPFCSSCFARRTNDTCTRMPRMETREIYGSALAARKCSWHREKKLWKTLVPSIHTVLLWSWNIAH